MRKFFILILLLAVPAIYGNLYAQSGGTKREGRAKGKERKTSVFKRKKSMGHADEFARGNVGNRRFFARLFRKEKSAWQYKPTKSGKQQERESRFLFFRSRSKGIEENEATLNKLNRERAKKRVRGSNTIAKKKHNRNK